MYKWIMIILSCLLIAGCASAVFTDSMEAGNAAFEKENYKDAIKNYEAALDEKPKNEEAIEKLEKAKKLLEINQLKELLEKGKKELANESFSKAVATFSSLVEKKSEHLEAKEIIKEAETLYIEALESNMNHLLSLAQESFEEGEYEQAQTYLFLIIKENNSNGNVQEIVNQAQNMINSIAEEKVQMVSEGRELISNSCISCHGGDLNSSIAPSLTRVSDHYTASEIRDIIASGIGSMPAFDNQFTEADLIAISSYLKEIASNPDEITKLEEIAEEKRLKKEAEEAARQEEAAQKQAAQEAEAARIQQEQQETSTNVTGKIGIEILTFEKNTYSDYWNVDYIVTNNTDIHIKWLTLKISLLDINGKTITSKEGLVNNLPIGESSQEGTLIEWSGPGVEKVLVEVIEIE